MAASLKKKRVSKKNKKSWRKNTDVSDVENFLEDKRLEERLGRNLTAQPSDELFSIDTKGGDVSVPEPRQADKPPVENSTRKPSLRLREEKTPKCFSLLERRTCVAIPTGQKIQKIRQPRMKKSSVPSVVAKPKAVKKRTDRYEKIKFGAIWDEVDKSMELDGNSDWLDKNTIRHTLINTGKMPKIKPNPIKPSPLPAIEPPHPGASYNPALKDYRQLVQTIAESEADLEKKEAHIERVTTNMFRKIPREEAEKAWMTEMSAGIDHQSDSSPEMGDYSTVNPPVQRKKKTLKERRKARENRERLRTRESLKVEKKKRADVNERLTKIKEKLLKNDEESAKYQERKKQRILSKVGDTKQLGRVKYEEPLLQCKSPHELRGSLRQLEPTGSVLSDRFYSLQKRNIVEPTLKRDLRSMKVKKFMKSDHKTGWEPKGYNAPKILGEGQ